MPTISPLLAAGALALALATTAARPQPSAPSDHPAPPAAAAPPANADASAYVGDKLRFPAHYREWVYLTSGLDMTYRANDRPDHAMFDNVFVDPQSYRTFVQTGTWPDGTTLVVETRGAQSKGSINQGGHYQDGDVMGIEVHVKDAARFPGRWAFFAFDDEKPAAAIARDAGCYACHEKHGAVDTTFVQFYPTLLPIARARQTLAASYLAQGAER